MPKRRSRAKVISGTPTRKQAVAEFGRKKARLRMRHLKRRGLMVAGIAVVAYMAIGGWWLHHNGRIEKAVEVTQTAFWQMTADMGFRLNQVYLTGRDHADMNVVKAALGVKSGAPILALPLAEMKKRLETIPEVKTVVIERELPGTLKIALIERQPAALWQRDGSYLLVDTDSVVLSREKYPSVGKLPLMVGDDAPRHVQELLGMLDSAPMLRAQVIAAIRVGERRWNVQLDRNITVLLPESAPKQAWLRFASMVERDGLLTRAIRSVDMRLEDRVFIMPLEQQTPPVLLTNARET
jgi:cell division protein FtsQ